MSLMNTHLESMCNEATAIMDELHNAVPHLLNIRNSSEELRFRQAILSALRKIDASDAEYSTHYYE